jgi:ribosomal-protein-alanine N-acetyltransferase
MIADDIADLICIEKQSHFTAWDKAFFLECINTKYTCVALEDAPTTKDGEKCKGQSKVLAYGVYSMEESVATIMNVAVHPAYRRRGLGRRLIIHMSESAISFGARRVKLLVAENNSAARALYRSLNFNNVQRLHQYYQTRMDFEDAIVMEKDISPQ